MPSGQPMATAWVQVRADGSKLSDDVKQHAGTAGTQAAGQIKGGFVQGIREGILQAKAEADTQGVQVAQGMRGGLEKGLVGFAEKGKQAGGQAGSATGKEFIDKSSSKIAEGSGQVEKSTNGAFKSVAKLGAAFVGLEVINVFGDFVKEANESAAAARVTQQVITTTGGAAHVTAKNVDDLTLSLSEKTGVDDDVIRSGANMLLTFTNIRNEVGRGNDIFNQATSIVTDMSVALGEDTKNAAIQLGKALQDPINGVTSLARVGVTFTSQQKEQIKTLVQTGHTMEAQKIILGELGREFGGAAAAASNPLQRLQVTLTDIAKRVGGQLLPAFDKAASFILDEVIPAIGAITSFLGKVPGPVYAAISAFIAFGLAVKGFGKGFDVIHKSVTDLRESVGEKGLLGVLGGPWGLAFTAATTIASFWIKSQIDAKERVEELSSAIKEDSGAIGENTAKKIADRLENEHALEIAQQLGISVDTVTRAALGNADAYQQVRNQLAPYLAENAKVSTVVGYSTTSISGQADQANRLMDILGGLTGDLGAARQEQTRTATAEKVATEALKGQNQATKTATQLTNEAKQALQQWTTQLLNSSNALLGLRSDNRAYKQAVADATAAVKQNGRTLDENTQKGRDNSSALDNVTSSALKVLDSMVKNNAKGPDVRREWESQRKTLFDVYMQFSHNSKAANDYVDKYLGKVPPSVSTQVKTPGMDAAQRAFANLTKGINSVPNKSVTLRVNGDGSVTRILREAGHVQSITMRAAGGYVSGPGGPTEDKVPAMLSNGEYVVNARATAQHRQLLEAINASGSGALIKRASGGIVNRNVKINTDLRNIIDGGALKSMFNSGFSAIMSTLSKGVASNMGALLSPAVGGAGVSRWAPVILQALRILGQSPAWLGTVESRMNRESGGNPTVVNRWDINWQRGTPSVGLMQVIGPTFAAYAGPFRNNGPFEYGVSVNPLANVFAGLNYALNTYGSLGALSRPGGYDAGGVAMGPGLIAKYTPQPERVLDPAQSAAFQRWMDRGSPTGDTVRLHPNTVAQLGHVIAASMTTQPVVIDGKTLTGYVDRRLGVSGLSVRG